MTLTAKRVCTRSNDRAARPLSNALAAINSTFDNPPFAAHWRALSQLERVDVGADDAACITDPFTQKVGNAAAATTKIENPQTRSIANLRQHCAGVVAKEISLDLQSCEFVCRGADGILSSSHIVHFSLA